MTDRVHIRRELSELAYALDRLLAVSDAELATGYPGDDLRRQPVHTAYVPAHRFGADTVRLRGSQALGTLEEFAPAPAEFAEVFGLHPELAEQLVPLVQAKLTSAARAADGLEEPATGRALARYLGRALDCGAVAEAEVKTLIGLDRLQLRAVGRSGIVPS